MLDRLVKVNGFAIYLSCYSIFLQADTNRFRHLFDCRSLWVPPNCSIWQSYIDLHDLASISYFFEHKKTPLSQKGTSAFSSWFHPNSTYNLSFFG
ncbi:hypothetical protein D3C73_631420 [compost metagenome]